MEKRRLQFRTLAIEKSAKREQIKQINRLYKSYESQLNSWSKKLSKSTFSDKLNKTSFTALLFQREKGMSAKQFVTEAVAKTAGVLTAKQARNFKMQSIMLGIDMEGYSLNELKTNQYLQHQLYDKLRNELDMSVDECTEYWTENIIGSN